MTHHIFPPIVESKRAGADAEKIFESRSKGKLGSRGGHLTAGSSRSGSLSSCSERSYSSSYFCSCVSCSSPTHFCSCCRCRCCGHSPLSAYCVNGCVSSTPFTSRRCNSSAPLAFCCCSHGRMRRGPRHAHIPESIAEEMEKGEGDGQEVGGALGKHDRKRWGRKRRGRNCTHLPIIHAGVRKHQNIGYECPDEKGVLISGVVFGRKQSVLIK